MKGFTGSIIYQVLCSVKAVVCTLATSRNSRAVWTPKGFAQIRVRTFLVDSAEWHQR